MRLPRFDLRAQRREFQFVRDLLPFFVGTLAGKSSPAARPTRAHGRHADHDAETFSELQNAPEPKQFSTARNAAKRVYFCVHRPAVCIAKVASPTLSSATDKLVRPMDCHV
jgi:hypothetical protein